MLRPNTLVLMISMLVVAIGKSYADSASDLAVIVNKKTTVLGLTSGDLRSILLGEKEQWPNGQRVLAASLSTELPETKLVLKRICGMSEGDFKRYFMQLAFQGKSAYPPRIMRSAAALKALVSSTPGALGIIRARDVDGLVNVVALDGGSAGTENYKLAMSK